MKNMRSTFLFVLIATLFAFSGCNEDEDLNASPEATKIKITEKLDKLDLPLAMRNSNHQYAQEAVGYVEEVKNIASYFDYFEIPDDAERTELKSTLNQEEYYWTDGQTEIWVIYTETSGGYTWQIDVDMGYGRQKYLYAEEDKDGNYGSMKVYDSTGETSEWFFQYEWTFNSAGDAELIWEFADGSMKYEIKSNIDYSGYARIFMSGVLFYDFVWNSDGSGSVTMYDDGGGVLYTEGWTVADL
ncbi:MAG: hypothetical protein PF489_12015 [Salinivirgaceae bacterium]|jgi:hypothetical protein|nr:hypothetical protein [Salinivirgaceae bacterium]